MNVISRFLPNLAPGLGALFNPWALLAIIVLTAMSAIGGARVELAQTDAVPVVANDGRVMLTGDFVRAYNLALGVAEPARDRPGRTPDDRARPHTVALRLEWCFAGGCVGESRTEREAMVRAPNAVTRLAGLGAA